MPETTKCKCGNDIAFVKSPDGAQMPVIAVRSAYTLTQPDLFNGVLTPVLTPLAQGKMKYINHFETCRYAREFHGKGKA